MNTSSKTIRCKSHACLNSTTTKKSLAIYLFRLISIIIVEVQLLVEAFGIIRFSVEVL